MPQSPSFDMLSPHIMMNPDSTSNTPSFYQNNSYGAQVHHRHETSVDKSGDRDLMEISRFELFEHHRTIDHGNPGSTSSLLPVKTASTSGRPR